MSRLTKLQPNKVRVNLEDYVIILISTLALQGN